MTHKSDADIIQSTHNTARYFVENRQIAWVLLLTLLSWGIYSYFAIPKAKDPDIPVRQALVITPWPGATAVKVEQLVTRQIEQTVAQNSTIHPPDRVMTSFGIKSLTMPGVSIVQINLAENVSDPEKEFSDINLRLNALNQSLPQGAGPIQFNSGFGDTSTLMLTIASPKESEVGLALRARDVTKAIEQIRTAATATSTAPRVSLVIGMPRDVDPTIAERVLRLFAAYIEETGLGTDVKVLIGAAFVGLDMSTQASDAAILTASEKFLQERLGVYRFHPDAWNPVVIRDLTNVKQTLAEAGGDRYSYRELDNFTDLIQRDLLSIPQVSKVQRSGVLNEQVFVGYSQEQLASYGLQPSKLKQVLNARNTTVPGGVLQADKLNIFIQPSGEFTSAKEIGDVMVTRSKSGLPVYLRNLANIYRGYQNPPRLLNFYSWRDPHGQWQRSRAISLAIFMRSNEQISDFGAAVDKVLAGLKTRLPDDLIFERVSDQPRQTAEYTDLFMTALYEAILLVVVVALIGFFEWRSAVLMMLAIPITLAMTFGMIGVAGITLQQVSVATLIIALGLLVDDPVVAGDAIKRDLALGHPPVVAAWLGPTKLAKAIMFATITNVVAYLPLLLIRGNTGDFLHSLPIVMACALIASRIVSMTFIPLLGYYLQRPRRKPELSIEERRTRGFSGLYYRVGGFMIDHRGKVLLASLLILVAGGIFKRHLSNAFFPDDVQYLSWVDVKLRNNAALAATDETAHQVEKIVQQVVEQYARENPRKYKTTDDLLESISTFVGGGAPRFWFTVIPEPTQSNYAQVIIRVRDKDATPPLAARLQTVLAQRIPGANLDVRQLQTNPVPYPVAFRISGRDDFDSKSSAAEIHMLRTLADKVKTILRRAPGAERIQDDWGQDGLITRLQIDPDRANLAGVTNQDVALSSMAAINGIQLDNLREGDKQIPIIARMRLSERAQLSDMKNLYVFAAEDNHKVPLRNVASITYAMENERIRRQEHFRAITVFAYPREGAYASDIYNAVKDDIDKLANAMPPGYVLDVQGEQANTEQSFGQLVLAMAISAASIFIALAFQFKSAVKPIIVFVAVPYGMMGALASLFIMHSPFSFMAFLGIVSLIGVIVSHVIVLFDFIEEMHEKGEPLRQALLDAGIVRLRPVMITIGATVTALIPLAIHGGPLWQPLCYAQIGGLIFATFVTLLLVPVVYSMFVLDFKIIHWQGAQE